RPWASFPLDGERGSSCVEKRPPGTLHCPAGWMRVNLWRKIAMKQILISLGALALVAGCTATERGAAVGGVTGAAVGAAVADDTVTGAVVGGAVGAAAGALIGQAS